MREHGVGSLDQAQRRADEARYQEVTCRSALNPVKGMPFSWTLNPYRGCTHGCHYCFARRYQTQFELGPGDEFSSLIFVKVNFAEVLARELDKPSWTRELVGARHRHGSVSADRRALQADAALAEGAGGRPHTGRASSPKGRWSFATRMSSAELRRVAEVHRLHQRADRRRGRVACARAGHRAPAATAACRSQAARRRSQRRRADGSGRPRLHHADGRSSKRR